MLTGETGETHRKRSYVRPHYIALYQYIVRSHSAPHLSHTHHLQVLVLAPIPEDSNTVIHEIRLIPDINDDTLQHAILPHILDDMRQILVPGRPVAIIARIRRRCVLRAVGAPEVVDQEDESSVVETGGAVVVQDGFEAVLVGEVSSAALSCHFSRRSFTHLILLNPPYPASPRRRNLGSARALVVPADVCEEVGWDLVDVVGEAVERARG